VGRATVDYMYDLSEVPEGASAIDAAMKMSGSPKAAHIMWEVLSQSGFIDGTLGYVHTGDYSTDPFISELRLSTMDGSNPNMSPTELFDRLNEICEHAAKHPDLRQARRGVTKKVAGVWLRSGILTVDMTSLFSDIARSNFGRHLSAVVINTIIYHFDVHGATTTEALVRDLSRFSLHRALTEDFADEILDKVASYIP